jgi:hypothetical protein
MLSHELANALLARRNQDLRFVVDVSTPGHDDAEETHTVQLADDRHCEIGAEGPAPEVLSYNSEEDFLEVRLGQVFIGEQGSYSLNSEEASLVLELLSVVRLAHPAQRKAAFQLRKAIETELG